jgi:hypothetical protein
MEQGSTSRTAQERELPLPFPISDGIIEAAIGCMGAESAGGRRGLFAVGVSVPTESEGGMIDV